MKNLFCCIFVLLLAAGCKGSGAEVPTVKKSYLETAVGSAKGGKFVVSNTADIKAAWEARMAQQHMPVDLAYFEIVQGITVGDAQAGYYLLIARTKNGNVHTASLLTLKGDEFFFEKQQGSESPVYMNIICSGEGCTDGCLPQVRISNGMKSLICSACSDCTKVEGEMH